MGKLTIEGKASKKYSYDLMEVSVTFRSQEEKTAQALKTVMSQSETFLAELEAAGIALETVQIGKDETSEDSYQRPCRVRAKRELRLCVPFNMDFANYIRFLVEKNALDADIETTYEFSNLGKIHEELIKLALEDSKTKAAYIAQSMGQKLVGVDSVVIGENKIRPLVYPAMERSEVDSDGQYDQLSSLLSKRVKAPNADQSETVEVVWLIE